MIFSKEKATKEIKEFQIWAIIIMPIVLGIIGLVNVITQDAYTEIEWVIYGIVASIYFNGMEAYKK